MTTEALESRITLLEDIEAIKKLKANYCLHVDHANEEGWVSLFTEDAVWESDKFGRFEGREAIRGLFRNIPEMLHFAIHYVMNPIIEVNGNRATGIWYLLEPCTFAKGKQATLGRRPLRRGVRQSRRPMEVQAAEAGFVVLDRIRPGMGEATLRDGLIARIMIHDCDLVRVARESYTRHVVVIDLLLL